MILFMSGTFVNFEVANHFRFSTGKALSLRELYLQQFSNKVGKYKEAIKSKLEMKKSVDFTVDSSRPQVWPLIQFLFCFLFVKKMRANQ